MSTSLKVREHRGGALRLDEPLGDRRAPLRHADALFGAIACRRAAVLAARAESPGRLDRLLARCRLPLADGRLLDVAPHDAAGVAAAAHAAEIDVVIFGRLARGRRRARLRRRLLIRFRARSGSGWRGSDALAAPGRACGRRPAASSITPSTSPTFTSSPSLRSMRLSTPPCGRRDLEVDLVGLELDERVADRDDVAFLAQPLRHAGVDDRLADFGDDDVRRHAKSSVARVSGLRSQALRLVLQLLGLTAVRRGVSRRRSRVQRC